MPVFERRTLGNGLRVLTAPLDHAQSVACFVMLAAGSRYEQAENRGIAHFAEHMFFKGTERRPTSRDLTTIVDGIGGEFNAFTSKEYTGYYVRCAADDRDIALDVLLDMLRYSKFDPDEIEREKGVILEEMHLLEDDTLLALDLVGIELRVPQHVEQDVEGNVAVVGGAPDVVARVLLRGECVELAPDPVDDRRQVA